MFGRLRDAYNTLIDSVLGYAASIHQADTTFRELHGFSPVEEPRILPFEAEEPEKPGRSRRRG